LLYERARDITLDLLPADDADAPLDPHLLQECLRPELFGYPVRPLVDVLISAQARDRARAYQLVDKCLSAWIAQLDKPIDRVYGGLPEVFDQIEGRQRATREALARVHAVLSGGQAVDRR